MSTHVETLFAEAERNAERVIALLRMFGAGSILLVVLVAWLDVRFMADLELARQIGGQLGRAAIVSALYFLLGALAWAIVASGRYRPWVSWVLVAFDAGFFVMAALVILAGVGLAGRYLAMVPPAFMPAIVLAFGALRYSPGLQAFITVLLLVATAALMTTEMGDSSAPPPVSDGLSFMFSAQPNLVRLVLIAIAGAIMTVAAWRARALLRRAIDESTQRANLSRYLPAAVAAQVARGDVARLRAGDQRAVAILFADIRGFTAMAETMAPQALIEMLSRFRTAVTTSADRHGGMIDKFIGDGAMVVFGVPLASDRSAADALACARTMLDEIAAVNRQADRNRPIEIGIGAHWGLVLCGALGGESRLEFAVIGDAVNVTARLQEATKQEGRAVIVSGELIAAAGNPVKGWDRLGERRLRGRGAPIVLYAAT